MGKYILTGGPGVGKTTLIEQLAARGYATVPEVAREIIREEQWKEQKLAGYTGIFPWNDLARFQDLVIDKQRYLEDGISSSPVFLDRSLIDPLAYMKLGGFMSRPDLYQLIEQADYTQVFFCEKLPFYSLDKERQEDATHAGMIHQTLYEIYREYGFEPICLPPVSIEERLDLIMQNIKDKRGKK